MVSADERLIGCYLNNTKYLVKIYGPFSTFSCPWISLDLLFSQELVFIGQVFFCINSYDTIEDDSRYQTNCLHWDIGFHL